MFRQGSNGRDLARGFGCCPRGMLGCIMSKLGLSNFMRPKILRRFLRTKSRHAQLGLSDPLYEGVETSGKKSRAMVYNDDRDRADRDSTSRLR